MMRNMTTRDLITILQKLPDNAEVRVLTTKAVMNGTITTFEPVIIDDQSLEDGYNSYVDGIDTYKAEGTFGVPIITFGGG